MARRTIEDYDVHPEEDITLTEKTESKRELEARKLKEQIKALELKNKILETQLVKTPVKEIDLGGRPEKYSKEFHPKLAELFYAMGGIDKDFAVFVGVTEPTIYNWKNKHKEFADALRLGKLSPDSKVEAALYHSAMEGSNLAQIFWLKNRQPGKWRDKQELDIKEHNIIISRESIEDND